MEDARLRCFLIKLNTKLFDETNAISMPKEGRECECPKYKGMFPKIFYE
jgi:hypothetical protein